MLAIIKDDEVCERLRGRWQRTQGRLTNGDVSSERWVELSAEIDKVTRQLRPNQLRKAGTTPACRSLWLPSSLRSIMSQ